MAESIADPDRRVVGVVINAVDDHLAKGDQVRVPWTARHIRPIEELLDVCRSSGRVVVLASDHGHVLERETELRDVEGAERWRPATGVPADDEILFEGPRVVTEGRRLLAPWSERVRFGMKKNGYHGGATLQEVVLPFGVFATSETAGHLAGWREAAPEAPAWWQWRVDTMLAPEPERPALKPAAPCPVRARPAISSRWRTRRRPVRRRRGSIGSSKQTCSRRNANRRQGRLFPRSVSGPSWQRWTDAAASSPAPHWRSAWGVPLFRLGGIVSALRRILNVEGYDVLSVDETSETVELNRDLLDMQFGLARDRK